MAQWKVDGTVDLRQSWNACVEADTPEQAEEDALDLLRKNADTVSWGDTSDAELQPGTEHIWDVTPEVD